MDSKASFPKWVAKSSKFLINKAKPSSKSFHLFDGLMVVNASAYCASPIFLQAQMEVPENAEGKVGNFIVVETGESSLNSGFLGSEPNLNSGSETSCSSSVSSSSSMGCCPIKEFQKPHFKLHKQASSLSETEMMKERFAKLLLGEDMSGCGNGVCTALAISNSITNLCATLFGQVWRLEPLQPEKKLMWRREMDWLLCVSDHIIELTPSWQTSPDGNKLEVMNSRPRSDLIANLPALRKLDNMLLEILDSFRETEFWYVDHGVFPRHQDKWWLPVPRVPPGGLNENARNSVQHRRDCANQILKAATAINSAVLAEMDVPDSYLEALPKNGKASLGDVIHRCINSERFSPELLLDCLVLSSEHQALEIANKVEGAVYIWRRFRTTNLKPCLVRRAQRSSSRSSWEMVKDLVSDADKREMLAGRAESLLACLRQRFPGLPQTALDMSKIQSNKDVGKSLLESYSRVLESMSFNIVARIDDLLHVDDLSKQSDQLRQLVSSGDLKKGHPSVLSS